MMQIFTFLMKSYFVSSFLKTKLLVAALILIGWIFTSCQSDFNSIDETTAILTQPTLVANETESSTIPQDHLLFQSFLVPSEVFLFNMNSGEEPEKLFDGQIVTGQPWSLDGQQFVFNSDPSYRDESSTTNLSLYDLRTKEVSSIPLLAKPNSIFWSPNGRVLLYVVGLTTNPPVEFVLFDFESKENRVLARIQNESDFFTLEGWSYDGLKFAFITKLGGQFDVFTLDVESLDVEQVTNTPAIEVFTSWNSANNEMLIGSSETSDEEIFFVTDLRPAKEIYLVNESNQATLYYPHIFQNVYLIQWSPNGELIAYSTFENGLCYFELRDEKSFCPLAEIFPPKDYSMAIRSGISWSADSNWMAFRVSNRNEVSCSELYIFELEATNVRAIDKNSCVDSPAYWSK